MTRTEPPDLGPEARLPSAAVPPRNAASDLRRALRTFAAQPSPRILAAALGGAVSLRVALGHPGWWDLIPPAAVVALQPFTEWVIHVFVLHFRPRVLLGWRLDPMVARAHRAHHADPRNLALVFIPLPALSGLLVGTAALAILPLAAAQGLVGLARGVSGTIGAFGMALVYEWTHYLIHSAYRPRHSVYRAIWRAHRNHHFRNERYWFGVTMHLADRVFRTYPDPHSVERSPTARTLGASAA